MHSPARYGASCPPPARRVPNLHRRLALAAMLPLVLTACAPDAWKPSPGVNSFVDKVQRVCGTKRMGEPTINDLLDPNSPVFSLYFLDMRSRWDAGPVSTPDYRTAMSTIAGGGVSDGLKCILALKPQ